MTTWFTADPHFGHEGIIKLCNRPFRNAQEMDRSLIDTYNRLVKPNDILYMAGDFGWGDIHTLVDVRRRIKCNNIIFIWGNHDKKLQANLDITRIMFRSMHYMLDIQINNQWINLCHRPFREWDGMWRGSWHLFGHVHNNLPEGWGKSHDVGVDANNYEPVSFEQIQIIMQNYPELPPERRKNEVLT